MLRILQLTKLHDFHLGCYRNASFFRLPGRALIELRGNTAPEFLQGLMTNDINLVKCANKMMYALFLNAKGRVFSDSLIYNLTPHGQNEPHFLVECDTVIRAKLLKFFRFYNIRKKVAITEEIPSTDVWVGLPNVGDSIEIFLANKNALFWAEDPRAISGWSWRLLVESKRSLPVPESGESFCHLFSRYTHTRYHLGLPEGSCEVRPGEALPLEVNADICNGISFNKGCYIGQELTARTRFVGVIRRRLVPIILESELDDKRLPYGTPIYHVERVGDKIVGNRPVGWIRAVEPIGAMPASRQCGLALLRLAECANALSSGDRLWCDLSGVQNPSKVDPDLGVSVKAFAPSWWNLDTANNLPPIVPGM